MAEKDVAGQLARLDRLLHQRQDEQRQLLRRQSQRQQRLNELHRALLRVFQSRAQAVSVKMFRLVVEAGQAARNDLSKAVQAQFEPEEFESLWQQIAFVQLSLATTTAPALRGYLGHIAAVICETGERCAVLIFPTLENALGSLEPLEGRVTRIEASGPLELRGQEAAIDAAVTAGLELIIERVERE